MNAKLILFFLYFLQTSSKLTIHSETYYDRYLLDSPYNLCIDPLMRKGQLDATSSAHQRGPHEVNDFA